MGGGRLTGAHWAFVGVVNNSIIARWNTLWSLEEFSLTFSLVILKASILGITHLTRLREQLYLEVKPKVRTPHSSFLQTPLCFCSECESFRQSVEPHGQTGVPPCQVEFRKHSSCCLVWAPCVGAVRPLSLWQTPSCAHKHRKPQTDKHDLDFHDYGALLKASDAQKNRTSKYQLVQKNTHMKRGNVLCHYLCGSGVPAWRLCASASISYASLIS